MENNSAHDEPKGQCGYHGLQEPLWACVTAEGRGSPHKLNPTPPHTHHHACLLIGAQYIWPNGLTSPELQAHFPKGTETTAWKQSPGDSEGQDFATCSLTA